jgi:hypothetical protein
VLENGAHVVDNVTASNGNIRIAVKSNEERASRERVAGVERVTDESSSVDGRATLERRAGLYVVIEGKVVVGVFVGRVRGRAGRRAT